ncbi:MAG: helix-turn-helix domain-containing protein [Pseudomonadota bacterium]
MQRGRVDQTGRHRRAALSPPFTFTRRVKATFGVTPSKHLLELRLERVKALLVDTDLSIARISYECGFSSQAHLTTRFSEAFGLTPAKYRRAHQRR